MTLKDRDKIEEDIENLPFDTDQPIKELEDGQLYQFFKALGLTDRIIQATHILNEETDKSIVEIFAFLFENQNPEKNYCPNCGEEL